MDAPRNWLSALITTDCLLPRVVNEMFAVNPGALATTWKLPLLRVPQDFRSRPGWIRSTFRRAIRRWRRHCSRD